MSTVVEIEDAIKRLPCTDLSELRQWLDEFIADQWDDQIKADAQSGKLDFLLQQADEAHRTGKVRSFSP